MSDSTEKAKDLKTLCMHNADFTLELPEISVKYLQTAYLTQGRPSRRLIDRAFFGRSVY